MGLVHAPFEKLAKMQAQQLGMPNAPILIYSQDLAGNDPPEMVLAKAKEVAKRALELLLRP